MADDPIQAGEAIQPQTVDALMGEASQFLKDRSPTQEESYDNKGAYALFTGLCEGLLREKRLEEMNSLRAFSGLLHLDSETRYLVGQLAVRAVEEITRPEFCAEKNINDLDPGILFLATSFFSIRVAGFKMRPGEFPQRDVSAFVLGLTNKARQLILEDPSSPSASDIVESLCSILSPGVSDYCQVSNEALADFLGHYIEHPYDFTVGELRNGAPIRLALSRRDLFEERPDLKEKFKAIYTDDECSVNTPAYRFSYEEMRLLALIWPTPQGCPESVQERAIASVEDLRRKEKHISISRDEEKNFWDPDSPLYYNMIPYVPKEVLRSEILRVIRADLFTSANTLWQRGQKSELFREMARSYPELLLTEETLSRDPVNELVDMVKGGEALRPELKAFLEDKAYSLVQRSLDSKTLNLALPTRDRVLAVNDVRLLVGDDVFVQRAAMFILTREDPVREIMILGEHFGGTVLEGGNKDGAFLSKKLQEASKEWQAGRFGDGEFGVRNLANLRRGIVCLHEAGFIEDVVAASVQEQIAQWALEKIVQMNEKEQFKLLLSSDIGTLLDADFNKLPLGLRRLMPFFILLKEKGTLPTKLEQYVKSHSGEIVEETFVGSTRPYGERRRYLEDVASIIGSVEVVKEVFRSATVPHRIIAAAAGLGALGRSKGLISLPGDFNTYELVEPLNFAACNCDIPDLTGGVEELSDVFVGLKTLVGGKVLQEELSRGLLSRIISSELAKGLIIKRTASRIMGGKENTDTRLLLSANKEGESLFLETSNLRNLVKSPVWGQVRAVFEKQIEQIISIDLHQGEYDRAGRLLVELAKIVPDFDTTRLLGRVAVKREESKIRH